MLEMRKMVTNEEIIKNTLKNWFYWVSGLVFLALSKVKNIMGYSTPKPFSINEFQRCVEYDINVVDNWIAHLTEYGMDNKSSVNGNNILELGPGSDLGVGLYLLSKSAKEYSAIDVVNLVQSVPEEFYVCLLTQLKENNKNIDTSFLISELNKTRNGTNDKLNYICRNDFDIVNALGSRKIDIVFSQAAFEHFDNIDETIQAISAVTVQGAILIANIDLKTHSRWIREQDPNNIYRYPKRLYGLFGYRGIPNRVRPYQYKEALERNGWENVKIEANDILSEDRYNFVKKHFDNEFIEEKNQMNYLSIWVYATKT